MGLTDDKLIVTMNRLATYDALIKKYIDDICYSETEIDSLLRNKSDTGHTHTVSEISNFPTSLPASDVKSWAKASTKPSYTASEVGAAASNHKQAYVSAECTDYTSDENTMGITPAAVRKAFSLFNPTALPLKHLGYNPISSTTDDTTAKWTALGTGYAYYNINNLLNNQQSQYAQLINFIFCDDVFQIWNCQPSGPTYLRSGNASGWAFADSGYWRKIYDTANKPSASDVGAASSSHNHSASNITSGTLAVTRGGTGATSFARTDYTTIGYRGMRFATSDTNPSSNGTICWTYS